MQHKSQVSRICIKWTPAALAITILAAGCHRQMNSAISTSAALSSSDFGKDAMSPENHKLLEDALARPRTDLLNSLLQQRPDLVNKPFNGASLIFDAAYFGNRADVQLLIDRGAEVNLKTPQGEAPLDRAEDAKATTVIALLKQHGAISSKHPPGNASR